jgi:hypothetical protein
MCPLTDLWIQKMTKNRLIRKSHSIYDKKIHVSSFKNFQNTIIISIFAQFILVGCSFSYIDDATGAMHLYGIGHLSQNRTKIDDKKDLVAYGVESVGINVNIGSKDSALKLGWNQTVTIEIISDDKLFSAVVPFESLTSMSLKFPTYNTKYLDQNAALPIYP